MVNNFLNRELSWLAFNKRVLEEAFNKKHPILERVNFLGISGSNLDEFFMVRVAGLKGQIDGNVFLSSIDDLLPSETMQKVIQESKKLKEKQNDCWYQILSDLKRNQVEVLSYSRLIKLDSYSLNPNSDIAPSTVNLSAMDKLLKV